MLYIGTSARKGLLVAHRRSPLRPGGRQPAIRMPVHAVGKDAGRYAVLFAQAGSGETLSRLIGSPGLSAVHDRG